MKDRVWEQVHTLMSNIKKLNEGDEIGGWLLGDWTPNAKDDKSTLVLDEFVIPKQKVSGVEVDMSPESMADILKELGPEKCNRIKAHWHIHPWAGKTDWSGTDEEKIRDFMDPTKARGLFVFLLSSTDTLKGRVELVFKGSNTFLGEVNLKQSFDDLEIGHEGSNNLAILSELEARIKEKVERKGFSGTGTLTDGDWRRYMVTDKSGVKALEDKVLDNRIGSAAFRIKRKGTKLKVRLDPNFWEWIEENEESFIPDAVEVGEKWAFLEFNTFTVADAMDEKSELTNNLFEMEELWKTTGLTYEDVDDDPANHDRSDKANEQTYFAY